MRLQVRAGKMPGAYLTPDDLVASVIVDSVSFTLAQNSGLLAERPHKEVGLPAVAGEMPGGIAEVV